MASDNWRLDSQHVNKLVAYPLTGWLPKESLLNIAHREYVYSAVNVLTNSPNIFDLTKADFFQLNLSQIHGKIG